jgi:hypothetical protein
MMTFARIGAGALDFPQDALTESIKSSRVEFP